MSINSQKKDERLDFRVTSESKALFARAADITGMSMSAFILEAARERATRLIEEQGRMVLKNEARDVFLNTLETPPAPSEALRLAAEKYSVKK